MRADPSVPLAIQWYAVAANTASVDPVVSASCSKSPTETWSWSEGRFDWSLAAIDGPSSMACTAAPRASRSRVAWPVPGPTSTTVGLLGSISKSAPNMAAGYDGRIES